MTRNQLLGSFALVLIGAVAQAQNNPCIKLKETYQKAEHYTDAQGQPATRLLDLGKVVPGDEVVYSFAVTNSCDKPAAGVLIDQRIPKHRTYIKSSAKGDGTDRLFSTDGVNYAKFDQLSVKSADGSTRPAVQEDIKAIRWVFNSSVEPGANSEIHFHTIAK